MNIFSRFKAIVKTCIVKIKLILLQLMNSTVGQHYIQDIT